jgi:hypothetical protein
MGSKANLRCKNLEVLMSALGQKQTSRSEIAMSAIPPKADIVHGGGCPLWVKSGHGVPGPVAALGQGQKSECASSKARGGEDWGR